jgi:uncharacterized phage-associated protein
MIAVACRLSCFDVAKYFLTQVDEDAEDFITNLKLQKLSYYAQGFYLAINDEPLFPEVIEAWQHGPVVPDLYQEYKIYGANPIPIPGDIDFSLFNTEIRELLDEVYCVYGQFSPWKLRDMTHSEPPWIEAYQKGNSVISLASMSKFFKNQLADD